jgi:hypothetical protein
VSRLALASTAVALGASLILAPSAAVHAASGPGSGDGLSIRITDGRDGAAPGDTLRYRVTVENGGAVDFSGRLEVQLPSFVTADGLQRDLTVPAGSSRKVSLTARVGEPGTHDYQVLAMAAVTDRGSDEILVRGVDADRLPGTTAPVVQTPAPPASPAWPWVVGSAGVVVVLGVLAALVILVSRRRRSRVLGGRTT